jgi:hypothetical protein
MCGLPQAGKLANDQLKEFLLAPHGCYPLMSLAASGLRKHNSQPIAFAAVVNNFTIKHTKKEDAEHSLTTLKNSCLCHQLDGGMLQWPHP